MGEVDRFGKPILRCPFCNDKILSADSKAWYLVPKNVEDRGERSQKKTLICITCIYKYGHGKLLPKEYKDYKIEQLELCWACNEYPVYAGCPCCYIRYCEKCWDEHQPDKWKQYEKGKSIE